MKGQIPLVGTKHQRIVDIHGAKNTKIRPVWYVLLEYFTTRPSIKNLNVVF